ncbi:MAG: triose-phosphate isomerase [Candidatus Omnitrophota bacterium]|jgi:phosphomannomutase/triosephosphate isomerase/glucose-6-phosphate isomerase/fructose/tagatose bisphosphate aldolase
MVRKIVSLVLSFGLLFQQVSFAQVAAELKLGNYLSQVHSNFVGDKFRPVHLRYFSYDSTGDNLKVLLDRGDVKNLGSSELEASTRTLLNYFLIGVTLTNDTFWVNLRPDSENEVIDNKLGMTDVGKIMLEADLQLKKDTAKFTSPETTEGKLYWDKLYKKAEALFGTENVSIPTLTRPWIVPNEIIIRESGDSAYIYKATMKVMLEQDYLKDSSMYNFKDARMKALNEYSSEIIRELIIPKLTKEINTAKRYASLRQVFYSLVLSRWFKSQFAGKAGQYPALIDKNELTGLTSKENWSKNTYFKAYQKSFKEGEYDIKVPVRTPSGQVIRSYFSGGEDFSRIAVNKYGGVLDMPGIMAGKGGLVSVDTLPLTGEMFVAQKGKGKKSSGSPVVSQNVYEQNALIIGQRIKAANSKYRNLHASVEIKGLTDETGRVYSGFHVKEQGDYPFTVSLVYKDSSKGTYILKKDALMPAQIAQALESSLLVLNSRASGSPIATRSFSAPIGIEKSREFYKEIEKQGDVIVLSVNMRNPVALRGIFRAAKETGAPVIIQRSISEFVDNYLPADLAWDANIAAQQEGFTGSWMLKLDHATVSKDTPEAINHVVMFVEMAKEAGFGSYAIDCSKLVDFTKATETEQQRRNYEVTAEIVKRTGIEKSAWEGEIGEIVGTHNALSTVAEAIAFLEGIERQGINSLPVLMAINNGSEHGNVPGMKIDLDRTKAINDAIYQRWGIRINQHGITGTAKELFPVLAGVGIRNGNIGTHWQNIVWDVVTKLQPTITEEAKVFLGLTDLSDTKEKKVWDKKVRGYDQELMNMLDQKTEDAIMNAVYLSAKEHFEVTKAQSLSAGSPLQGEWTKKDGQYRPVRLMVQANDKSDLVLLRSLGADGALTGHSETREAYNLDNNKVNALLSQSHDVFNTINVLAMGEPANMRDANGDLTKAGWDFIRAQVTEGLAGLTREQILMTIIAYEPIWAIGPKAIRPAKSSEADEVQAFIRNEILSQIIPGEADKIIIQYGGSMSAKTAADLMAMVNVDGGLIGGASLTKEAALTLIKTIVETVRNQKAAGTFSGRIPVLGFNLKAEVGGEKMKVEYLRELMDFAVFVNNNLQGIDLENDIRIFFAVNDTDMILFDRALKGENPVDLLDLSKESLPKGMELAVSIDQLSSNKPGAYTSDITAEALKLAGVKKVVITDDVNENDARIVRAKEAGLGIVNIHQTLSRKQKSFYVNDTFIVTAGDVVGLKYALMDASLANDQDGDKSLIIVPAALARQAYLDARSVVSAASPLNIVNETVIKESFDKLLRERAEARLNSLYGLSQEDAIKLDPTFARIGFDGKANRLGWGMMNLNWLFENPQAVNAVLEDAEAIRNKYTYVIFCGMGGSGLSVQTVKTTFGEREVKIYSLRTTDPAVIADMLNEIAAKEGSLENALAKTLVIPISKSGTTEETVSHKRYFETLFGQSGLDAKDHMWVVTDKGSPMDTGDYNQREIQLNGKGDIGGRFTAPTTNIFLLPMALVAPEKVWQVLSTAKKMNQGENGDMFLKLAAFLYSYAKNERKDKMTLIVPEEMKDISIWAEQLFEESLGKDGKGVTLFYGEKLSSENLLPADTNDRVFVRINFKGEETNSELGAYLKDNNYPLFDINVEDKDSIGGIMLGFQRTVASIAYLWDICFVDQPAVEGYKKGTREVMAKVAPGEKVSVPAEWKYSQFNTLKVYYGPLLATHHIGERELNAELERLGADLNNAPAVYAAIITILKSKPGFEALELMSYGRMTAGLREVLEAARYDIFTNGLKMAAKLGEGPDKNHSFHQNIEAGREMFLSTYFMPMQVDQPSALEYSENLIKAQTIGTVKALVASNRKAVLITADATTDGAVSDMQQFFAQVQKFLSGSVASAQAGTAVITSEDDGDKPLVPRFSSSSITSYSEFVTKNPIKFGTSGWRFDESQYMKDGVFMQEWFLNDFYATVTAAADQIRLQEAGNPGRKGVLISGDTRATGPYTNLDLSRLAAEKLASLGIEVYFVDHYCPLPVVSVLIGRLKTAGSLYFTASHNPGRGYQITKDDGSVVEINNNGLKFNPAHSGPAEEEITGPLQKNINTLRESKHDNPFDQNRHGRNITAMSMDKVAPLYIEALQEIIDFKAIATAFEKGVLDYVVIDPKHGSATEYYRAIMNAIGLKEGVQYEIINAEPDPSFSQWDPETGVTKPDRPEPAAEYSKHLVYRVNELRSQGKKAIAISADPDADRNGVVSAEGNFIDPNMTFAIEAQYLIQQRFIQWLTNNQGREDVAALLAKSGVAINDLDSFIDKDSVYKRLIPLIQKFVNEENIALATTIPTSHMMKAIADRWSCPLYVTKVGFKWFNQYLLADSKTPALIAGEESQGLNIKSQEKDPKYVVLEKDALVAGFKMVEINAVSQATPEQLAGKLQAEIGFFAYNRGGVDLRAKTSLDKIDDLKAQLKAQLDELKENLEAKTITELGGKKIAESIFADGYKIVFTDGSWLCIRFSGTEPVVRLYTEAIGKTIPSADKVRQKVHEIGEQLLELKDGYKDVVLSGLSTVQKIAGQWFSQVTDAYLNRQTNLYSFYHSLLRDLKMRESGSQEAPIEKISGQVFSAADISILKSAIEAKAKQFEQIVVDDPAMKDTIKGAFSGAAKELQALLATLENSGSSPLVNQDVRAAGSPIKKGGIDFRTMNIITKPMGSFEGLNLKLPLLSKGELANINLDVEIGQIKNMVASGIVPSGERLKELVAACSQKGELQSRRDDLVVCLAEICRLQEEDVAESSAALRETLVILDSRQLALAKL